MVAGALRGWPTRLNLPTVLALKPLVLSLNSRLTIFSPVMSQTIYLIRIITIGKGGEMLSHFTRVQGSVGNNECFGSNDYRPDSIRDWFPFRTSAGNNLENFSRCQSNDGCEGYRPITDRSWNLDVLGKGRVSSLSERWVFDGEWEFLFSLTIQIILMVYTEDKV